MTQAQTIPISTRPHYDDSLRGLHLSMIGKMAAIKPPRLWLEPDQTDMEDYGTYMRSVLEVVKEFHGAACGFVGLNGAGNIDDVIRMGAASLTDMQSDFEGAVNSAAEELGHKL